MKKINTEILIIGFGKAGKTLAAYLGKKGIQTILVEQSEKMYGGTCINIGCIPTKALILHAERKTAYSPAIAMKNELTSFLRQANYNILDKFPSVQIITGKASFVNPNEVRILKSDLSEVVVHADKIFINTGAEPIILNIPGIGRSTRVYTSTTLLDETELPKKLTIVGGGFIGLEFASMFARYGSKVTILNRSSIFLPEEDEDVATEIKNVLQQKGITIINQAVVEKIQPNEGKDRIFYRVGANQHVIEAHVILIATGRKAYTEGLDLEAANIKTDENGFIKVNRFLQTNVPNIWALGDINGGPKFTFISLDDFRIIKDQLFENKQKNLDDRENVAFCVFTSPPFAHVGMREREAIANGLPVKIAKIPARIVPRTSILQQSDGVLKVMINTETDQILGCTLFCAEAQEMINTVRIAMNMKITFTRLKNEIYAHPSMTEAFNYFD